MTTVDDLQHQFLDHVIDADRPIAVYFAPGAKGLAIYRHAYRAQLISCLKSNYDKSWSWMGDERFDIAAGHYVDRHIPRNWSLDHYGADFPAALAELFPDEIEIAELATFERAMQTAFVKADAVAADQGLLVNFIRSGRDMERLRLLFVPSFRAVSVSTNVAAIWQAIGDESEMPPLIHFSEPHIICIWRIGHINHFREIDGAEADALAAMWGGADFGSICAIMTDIADPESAATLFGGWLARWIGDGMISGLI